MSQDDDNTRSVSLVQALENPPIKNKPLLIRTRKEPNLYLTLCDGELLLIPNPRGGSFWYCVRKAGWYGFRNTVSGTYLGSDASSSICARQHSFSEFFTAERDVDGGYILNIFRSSDNNLMPLFVSNDNKHLFPRNEGGMAWDFITPKYLQSSVSFARPDMEPERLRLSF